MADFPFFQNSGYSLELCSQSHWASIVFLICVIFGVTSFLFELFKIFLINLYMVIVRKCVNSSYYDARQIFPFIFLKIFFLVTLLRKRFTLFLKKKKTNDVTLVIKGWKNGMVLRLSLYTFKSMEQHCKIFKQVVFWEAFVLHFYALYQLQPCVCGMGEFELLTTSAEKSFAVGLVHTFLKQRLQVEEYNSVGQMQLNMYVWLNVLKWSKENF